MLHTGDNHLDIPSRQFLSKDMARRGDFLRSFESIVTYALSNKPEVFLITGDLFDTVNPRNPARKRVMDLLRQLKEAGTNVIAISGHHDTPKSQLEGMSPLILYETPGYLQFLKTMDTISTREFNFQNISAKIYGMSPNPALPQERDPLEGKTFSSPADVNLLLLHGNIQGLSGASGTDRTAQLKSVPEFVDYVAAGHIHTRTEYQRENEGNENPTLFAYSGSSEFVSFGEDLDAKKGFYWLEFDKSGLLEKGAEFIPLETRPVHSGQIKLANDVQNLTGTVIDHIKANADPEVIYRLAFTGELTTDNFIKMRQDAILRAGIDNFFHFMPDFSGLTRDPGALVLKGESVKPVEAYENYLDKEIAALGTTPQTAVDESASSAARISLLREVKELGLQKLKSSGGW